MVRVIDVNDASLAMHHARSREELLNRLPLIFTPDSLPAFQAQLRAIWHGESTVTAETTVRTLDGEIRAVLLRWKVASGHETTLDRVIVSQEDITERKAAADQLAQALGKLRRSNAELEQVTFVTAHDLLEPVRAVVSFSQLIVTSPPPAWPYRNWPTTFLSASGGAAHETTGGGLHRYATICQNRRSWACCRWPKLVNDALRRPYPPDGDAVIELGPLPEIIGNRLLTELFVQLLENCLKFRGPEPLRIAIAAEPQPQGWRFRSATTASASIPLTSVLFDLFRRPHGPANMAASASACRCAARSWNGTMARSTSTPAAIRGRRCFDLPAAPLASPPPEL